MKSRCGAGINSKILPARTLGAFGKSGSGGVAGRLSTLRGDGNSTPVMTTMRRRFEISTASPRPWSFLTWGGGSVRGYATENNTRLVRRELELLEDAYRAGVPVARERVVQALRLSARTHNVELVKQMSELGVRLLPKDRVVRNTVAGAHAQLGAGDQVLRAMEQMRATGIKSLQPNAVTWNALIGAYAKAGERGKALTAMDQMQEAGFRPDRITFNSIIKAHVSVGDIDAALAVFEFMKARGVAPDSRTYSLLIDGHLKQGRNDDALHLLSDMEGRRIAPSLMTLTSFIYANTKANALDAAQRILERLRKEGQQPDRVAYTAIIEGLARSGLTDQAFQVFKEMVDGTHPITPDALTYSSLLKACSNPESAMSLYEDMQRRGVVPDIIFYSDLIRAQVSNAAAAADASDSARINELADKAIEAGLHVTPLISGSTCRRLLRSLASRPHSAVRAWRNLMGVRDKLPSRALMDHETLELARTLINQIGDTEALAELESAANEQL